MGVEDARCVQCNELDHGILICPQVLCHCCDKRGHLQRDCEATAGEIDARRRLADIARRPIGRDLKWHAGRLVRMTGEALHGREECPPAKMGGRSKDDCKRDCHAGRRD